MWDSVVAVLGTLAGTGMAYGLQQRSANRAEREARARDRAAEIRTAVLRLDSALTVHRRAQFDRWRIDRDALGATAAESARRESWSTRSAVTDAVSALRLVTTDRQLLDAADAAVGAAYSLKAPAGQADMDVRADRARKARDELLTAAARYTAA